MKHAHKLLVVLLCFIYSFSSANAQTWSHDPSATFAFSGSCTYDSVLCYDPCDSCATIAFQWSGPCDSYGFYFGTDTLCFSACAEGTVLPTHDAWDASRTDCNHKTMHFGTAPPLFQPITQGHHILLRICANARKWPTHFKFKHKNCDDEYVEYWVELEQ